MLGPCVRGNPVPDLMVSVFAGKKTPKETTMSMPDEHRGYSTTSLVERLAIAAIVISGVAAGVISLYLLW